MAIIVVLIISETLRSVKTKEVSPAIKQMLLVLLVSIGDGDTLIILFY